MGDTTKAPSHDRLATIAWHIRILTQPFTIPVRQRPRGGPTTWTAHPHAPLLDQVREACTPSGGSLMETIRRRSRESQPPPGGAAVETLAHIEVAIAWWHAHLRLPSPDRALDWQKAALWQLDTYAQQIATAADNVQVAPSLADLVLSQLGAAVEQWWEMAARAASWQPDDLRDAQ